MDIASSFAPQVPALTMQGLHRKGAAFAIAVDVTVLEICPASPIVELFAVPRSMHSEGKDLLHIAEGEGCACTADLAVIRTSVLMLTPL